MNTISPGYVLTEMIKGMLANMSNEIISEVPMGPFAEPEEIARVVAFLADEKSSYITGSNITINGGQYML